MTDKEKIHQILSSLWKNDDSVGKTYYNQALQDVQTAIDLQEEPVSEDLEEAAKRYSDNENPICTCGECLLKSFKAGAKWGKNQAKVEIQAQSMALAYGCPEEPVSVDLGKAAGNYAFTMSGEDEVSKYYAFLAGAKWQKQKYSMPVSEEWIDVAKQYVKEHVIGIDKVTFSIATDMFVSGAKWQIAKLMGNATEVTVHIEAGNYPYIPQIELYDYDKDVPLAKEGDKYKVVLIKED